MASLEDIAILVGRTLEGVEQLRKDFDDEKIASRESRASIHRRLDDHAEDISRLRTDVAIMGQVDAQLRDEVKALAETVETNHKAVTPAVAEWKTMKRAGLGFTGLMALGGLSIGAILTWAGDTAVSAIRHWLRIT
jgi:hypothetical protein